MSANGKKTREVETIVIAVMGATGTGKSTFINLVSGSSLGVGEGLRSCTAAISNSEVFELDGKRVMLIDTPGFDDTTKSDTDILKLITEYLCAAYRAGVTLSGILYLHRITDNRMGGTSLKNLRMFRKLCGEATLRNVVLITTMWGLVDPDVGTKREQELKSDELFFKPLLEKGAQMARHDNTLDTAQKILRQVILNNPKPIRIQVEIVDEEKDLPETDAGADLHEEYEEMKTRHEEEMEELREEMAKAQEARDKELQEELEKEREELAKKARETQAALDKLSKPFGDQVVDAIRTFWDDFVADVKAKPVRTVFAVAGGVVGAAAATGAAVVAAGVAIGAAVGNVIYWLFS